ncbi:MAG: molybdopterin cofactor-binding domain-containing protein [Pseudomonadota bacterium]
MTNTFEFRKEFFADERDENLNEIGKRARRQDIEGHVTGRSPFFDDNLFDGLLHMRYVRSPHHHARIRRIDTSQAQGMPGVVRIVTGADVPTNLNTLLALLDFGLDDEPVLSDKKVAYVGEPVAAVIAHTEAEARAAVKAVQVDWEVLPHVHDVEEALKPGAPTVCDVYPGNAFIYHGKYDHQKLRFGDVDAAMKTADHVVESRHQMSPIEQAPIETCGAISAPEQNGRFVCYTGTQALFFSLGTASKVLNMPSSRLHFIGGTVGGGFGGKVDSIHEPLSILGTMLTGKPCKSQWDREEEMQVGAPRGAERWYITDGVMNDGRIVARKFRGYFDCGAYTRLSSYAVIKSVGHLPGPYTVPNVYADVYCVYTNRTPATAMRGFGITGVDFSIESHMDLVAEKVGMHPIDLRILNSYRDGDMKAHRRVAKNCAFIECCQVVAEKAGITIKPESKAASSLRDGGGARAQIPGFTATDQNGAVQGFESTSYARKGGGNATTSSVPSTPTPTAPVSQPASYQPAPASAPPTAPVAPPAPTTPPPNAAPTRKRSSTRFSSISGFRRR